MKNRKINIKKLCYPTVFSVDVLTIAGKYKKIRYI